MTTPSEIALMSNESKTGPLSVYYWRACPVLKRDVTSLQCEWTCYSASLCDAARAEERTRCGFKPSGPKNDAGGSKDIDRPDFDP